MYAASQSGGPVQYACMRSPSQALITLTFRFSSTLVETKGGEVEPHSRVVAGQLHEGARGQTSAKGRRSCAGAVGVSEAVPADWQTGVLHVSRKAYTIYQPADSEER